MLFLLSFQDVSEEDRVGSRDIERDLEAEKQEEDQRALEVRCCQHESYKLDSTTIAKIIEELRGVVPAP